MTLPRCSIVIPVHNKAALTRQCVDAILERPPEVGFEIIVVDDASTDSTPKLLAGYGEAVKAVRLDKNAGFATACNSGAAAAKGDHVLFLNNDTIPQERWLDTLIAYADQHAKATVVGSKLLFPDGSIQHAGVAFDLAGDPLHIYAGFPADHPAVNKSRRFQAVTAACLLIDHDAFREVGGFDTGYHNDLEDVDLCLRLVERGEEVHYCHESVLFHLESASRGYGYEPGASARLYRKNWRTRVRHDELDYYLEDGLLEILRTSPELIEANTGRRQRDAALLQKRSAQVAGLVRASLQASMAAAGRPNGHAEVPRGELVGVRRARSRPAGRARRRLEKRVDGLRHDLEAALGHEPAPQPKKEPPAGRAAPLGYPEVVAELPRAVGRLVPEESTVLVVSRGDDALVALDGPRGWHFPRAENGRYQGYHPATSEDAIAHLEELRSRGADHVVFPRPYLWWLDFYTGFAEHLARYRRIDEESCVIFDMRPPDADEALVSSDAEPAASIGEPDRSTRAAPMGPAEYTALAKRAKAILNAAIPAGATVLVVSRGDDVLTDLGDQSGWHFPRAEDGRYLGYYFETDEEAIAHLEQLRAAGAGYLAFPSTAFWWLDHYDSFAAHLRSHYQAVVEDDTCIVFALAEPLVSEVVESLLPADAKIAVVSRSAADLAGVGLERLLLLEPAARGAEAIGGLRSLVASGAEFLVVPSSAFQWTDDHPEFTDHLRARHRFVTRQRHACEIWELRPEPGEPGRSEPRRGPGLRGFLSKLTKSRRDG